mgnify:CR=1 FL=1
MELSRLGLLCGSEVAVQPSEIGALSAHREECGFREDLPLSRMATGREILIDEAGQMKCEG